MPAAPHGDIWKLWGFTWLFIHSLKWHLFNHHYLIIQRSAKVGAPGLGNFTTAVAYHFGLNLPAVYTQPGAQTVADLCNRHTNFSNDIINQNWLAPGVPCVLERQMMRWWAQNWLTFSAGAGAGGRAHPCPTPPPPLSLRFDFVLAPDYLLMVSFPIMKLAE